MFVSARYTVEDSLSLPISWFRENCYLYQGGLGAFEWTSEKRGKIASIFFAVNADEGLPGDSFIILAYSVTDKLTGQKEEITERIDIGSTPCHFGGVRYWFVCPSCRRRAGKLYLAPGTRHFRCRNCANLTYRSCQENDKRVNALAKNPESIKEIMDSRGKNLLLALKATLKHLEKALHNGSLIP
ncbi:MAG: hypothetical protein AB1611_14600 [bacterium]